MNRDRRTGPASFIAVAAVLLLLAGDGSAQDFNDPAVERVEDIENGAKRVVVAENSHWWIRIGSGETLEKLLIDIENPGANASIRASGDNWTIRNIGFKGKVKERYGMGLSGDNNTVDTVYLGDGALDDTRVRGVYITHKETDGPIDFHRVHIAKFANNGIYGSPTVEEERGGVINLYDSYFNSNNISNFKLGSPHDTCVVRDTVVRTDETPARVSFNGETGKINKRAMWALDNPDGGHPDRHKVLLDNVDIDGPIQTEPGAIVELQNTRWTGEFIVGGDAHEDDGDPDGELIGESEGEPDLTPPDGVPMSAYEAATGDIADDPGDDDPGDDDPLEEEPILEIGERTDSLVIDGKLDESDWQKAEVFTFEDADAHSDNEVDVRAVWDEDALHFGFEVDDAQLETASEDSPLRDDSVELFLDPLFDGGYEQQPDDPQVGISVDERALAKDYQHDEISDEIIVDYGVETHDDGFAIELSLSWDALDVEPELDLVMGALFANNDLDDGELHQFSHAMLDSFRQPESWSPIALVEAASSDDGDDDAGAPSGDEDAGGDGEPSGSGDAGGFADTGSGSNAGQDSHGGAETSGCTSTGASPAHLTALALFLLGLSGLVARRRRRV